MPPRRLTDQQIIAVFNEFREKAKRLGRPPYELFTIDSIAKRLEEKYGVKYNKGNVWRRMVNNDWTFHRSPLTHEERMAAYEKNFGRKKR